MGFFYQALKKATGVATDTPEETLQADLEVRQPVETTPAPTISPRVRRRFDIKHPVESLVAFLSAPVEDQNMVAMEQCRVLRARIWEMTRNKGIKSLLMTSAMPGDGKTLLSVNLAFAMSQIEHAKVLLVDVDMRRPSVSRFLGLVPDKGLNTFLANGDSFDDVCWILNDSLDLVPTMTVEENSAELLHGKQMVHFLQEAKQRYDIIILDGPPLFPIVDAQVLAPLVDAAILVVREGKTPCEMARQAAEMIKPKFIGSILNGAEHNSKSAYYGGYYRYSNKPAKKKK
jgi:capsular exopolysaccharide synthesis family protein